MPNPLFAEIQPGLNALGDYHQTLASIYDLDQQRTELMRDSEAQIAVFSEAGIVRAGAGQAFSIGGLASNEVFLQTRVWDEWDLADFRDAEPFKIWRSLDIYKDSFQHPALTHHDDDRYSFAGRWAEIDTDTRALYLHAATYRSVSKHAAIVGIKALVKDPEAVELVQR